MPYKPGLDYVKDQLLPPAYEKLWEEFSDIQCATWMCDDCKYTADRFNIWLKSGDPADAWS